MSERFGTQFSQSSISEKFKEKLPTGVNSEPGISGQKNTRILYSNDSHGKHLIGFMFQVSTNSSFYPNVIVEILLSDCYPP